MEERNSGARAGVFIRSGQVWKAVAGLVAIVTGTGLIYWTSFRFQVYDRSLTVLLFGTILAAAGTILPWFAVRCPNCRDPWLWRAMSRSPHRYWLSRLLVQEHCPNCGYDP